MESFVDKSNSNQIEKLEDKIHKIRKIFGWEITEFFNTCCSFRETTAKYHFEDEYECFCALEDYFGNPDFQWTANDYDVCYEEVFSVRNPKDFPPKNKVDDEIFDDAYRDSDSLTAYDIELSDCKPVLVAIDCFKELQVYGELYGCIEDLVHYFDSDRDWRYDFT